MSGCIIAILGAGKASRFGGGKLDAPLHGRPLGEWALAIARSLDLPLVFVTGPVPPQFLADSRHAVEILVNPAPDAGIGASIALAAAAARRAGVDRLLILLADMPFVSRATLDRLMAQTNLHTATACTYPDAALGPPACFGADHFPLLENLDGQTGARHLLKGIIGAAGITVPAQELIDIDTQTDLTAANQAPKPF